MSDPVPPREIAAKPKAYAFERSLGIPPAEACRRAGGKVENGQATKWERAPRVQAWIAYYRSLGHTEEILAAKRARIEERLNLAAYGNIFDFAAMVERVVTIQVGEATEERIVQSPVIDWDKVAASPYGAIVSGFKFDKDTGGLVDFQRDDALQAINQLRDMHGFKAPKQLTGPSGGPLQLEVSWKTPTEPAEPPATRATQPA
jgi:hypothetical protein